MNIAIVGAGIIGITTAYELAADGHQVTVLERHGAAAEEASFAHAGRIDAATLIPWNTRIHPGWPLTARELGWLWHWRRNGRAQLRSHAPSPLQQLAAYSLERLHQLSGELQLEYERSEGSLTLLRTTKEVAQAQPLLERLRESGLKLRELNADEARALEPGLNPDAPLAAAVHWPAAEIGNSRLFALLLKQAAQSLGVRFAFQTTVTRIAPSTPVALSLEGEDSSRRFDAVILCAGGASAELLAPLGIRLPLAAVHGYSVSAPLRDPLCAPRSTVLDGRHQISISRLGQRVRVCGGADLGGPAGASRERTVNALYRVLNDWFPGAAQLSSGVQVWKGARPMMADGLPLIGASGQPGLWLNLGHGTGGWALACGSARGLADQIRGRAPEVDLTGFQVQRLPR